MSEKLLATELWVLQAQETIRQQQAEIDRLKGQRDRLLKSLKDTAVNEELLKGSGQGFIDALDDARALIAEIEAGK